MRIFHKFLTEYLSKLYELFKVTNKSATPIHNKKIKIDVWKQNKIWIRVLTFLTICSSIYDIFIRMASITDIIRMFAQ